MSESSNGWTAKQVKHLLEHHEQQELREQESLQRELRGLGERVSLGLSREAYEARHAQLERDIGYLRESFEALVKREESRRNYVDGKLSNLETSVREAKAEARGAQEAGQAQRELESRDTGKRNWQIAFVGTLIAFLSLIVLAAAYHII